jgi:hypothetical protein
VLFEHIIVVWLTKWSKRLSWEVSSCSAGQEFSCNLCKLKVYYHVHRCLPLTIVLIEMHPVHIVFLLISILMLSARLCVGLTLSLPFRLKFCLNFSSLWTGYIYHTSHPPWFVNLIFGEEHKLWSSLLCSFLHSPVIFSVINPVFFLSMFQSSVRHNIIFIFRWGQNMEKVLCKVYNTYCGMCYNMCNLIEKSEK